jgi:hypothetical protein
MKTGGQRVHRSSIETENRHCRLAGCSSSVSRVSSATFCSPSRDRQMSGVNGCGHSPSPSRFADADQA